jgi:MHS family citrate/tricarballylate:H+ symporter-like MFS transporter
MACGTVLIACVPSYATIGLFAPLLVVIGRLLQGFSAGVELGGVSVYLSEMATPGHKGFYVSWQSASQQAAIMVAAALGYAVNAWLAPSVIDDWGWRIPFFVGCMILPFVFYIRRSLLETEEFLARKVRPTFRESLHAMARNWPLIVAGMMMVVMTTVSFYLITVYTPTFGKSVLKLDATDALVVTFCVGLSNFILLPVMGALSDRVGRWPLLVTFTVLTLLTAYPVLAWLVARRRSAHARDRAVAVGALRELQRRGRGRAHRGDAAARAHGRLLARVRAGDGDLRRLHAAGVDVAHQGDRRPCGAGLLDERRGVRAACGLFATFLLYRGIVKER